MSGKLLKFMSFQIHLFILTVPSSAIHTVMSLTKYMNRAIKKLCWAALARQPPFYLLYVSSSYIWAAFLIVGGSPRLGNHIATGLWEALLGCNGGNTRCRAQRSAPVGQKEEVGSHSLRDRMYGNGAARQRFTSQVLNLIFPSPVGRRWEPGSPGWAAPPSPESAPGETRRRGSAR